MIAHWSSRQSTAQEYWNLEAGVGVREDKGNRTVNKLTDGKYIAYCLMGVPGGHLFMYSYHLLGAFSV